MAVDFVDRLAIMVATRHLLSTGAVDSRALRSKIYARIKEYVQRSTSIPLRRFLGDVRRPRVHAAPFYGSLWHTGFLSP
jgi:hypothetical protein